MWENNWIVLESWSLVPWASAAPTTDLALLDFYDSPSLVLLVFTKKWVLASSQGRTRNILEVSTVWGKGNIVDHSGPVLLYMICTWLQDEFFFLHSTFPTFKKPLILDLNTRWGSCCTASAPGHCLHPPCCLCFSPLLLLLTFIGSSIREHGVHCGLSPARQ